MVVEVGASTTGVVIVEAPLPLLLQPLPQHPHQVPAPALLERAAHVSAVVAVRVAQTSAQ